MDILNKIDEYLNESTTKDDYKKLLKVINSVETEAHAEAAEKMIDNWGKLDAQGKSISGSFGMKSVFDSYKDVRDLKTALNNTLRKKGIRYRTTK